MGHAIRYIGIMGLVVVVSCSQSPKGGATPDEDTIVSERVEKRWTYEIDSVRTGETEKVASTSKKEPVEDKRSFFQRGYDEGYDNGREDGVMDLGDGYSYNDANPYKGAAKREYERGYKRGYRKGYHDGFYEYSDGDEEEYDEW